MNLEIPSSLYKEKNPILASPSIEKDDLDVSIIVKGKLTQELLDSTNNKLIENNHFKSLKISCSNYSFTFFSTLLETAFLKKPYNT